MGSSSYGKMKDDPSHGKGKMDDLILNDNMMLDPPTPSKGSEKGEDEEREHSGGNHGRK